MSKIVYESEKRITQHYGNNNHAGVDIGFRKSESDNQVFAHSSGVVTATKSGLGRIPGSTGTLSYGNYIDINHENGYMTRYAHLNKVYVKVGERVNEGTCIGTIGDSGNTTGRHLHFEVFLNGERINPEPFLTEEFPIRSENVEYRVHTKNGTWLPWVTKVDDTNEGYAGIYGRVIDGIQIKDKTYQSHILGGEWLSYITNYNDSNADGYSGIYGRSIDGIKVKDATYRVHVTKKGKLASEWLPWVSKVDNTNDGYAGYYGRSIDGIQVKK